MLQSPSLSGFTKNSITASELEQPIGRKGLGKFSLALGLVICVISLIFATIQLQLLNGIIASLIGLGLILFPPRLIAKPVALGAILFWLASGLALLPQAMAGKPEWREKLSSLGLHWGGLISPHPIITFEHWLWLGLMVIAGVQWLNQRVNDRQHLLLGALFSLSGAIYALLCLLQQEKVISISWDLDSSFGLFPNRNHTATLLAMSSILSLGVLFQAIRMKRNVLTGISAISLVVCVGTLLGFSASRAGVLLLAVCGLAWIIFLGEQYLTRRNTILAVAILAICTGGFLFLNPEVRTKIADSVARELEQETSGDLRVPVYKDCINMIKSEPWTGTGIGTFSYIFPQYRDESMTASLCVHPESDWLMLAAEQGILAALVYLCGLLWLFRYAFRQARSERCWPLRWATILAAAIVPIHGLFDVPGHRIGLALSAIFLLALALRRTDDELKQKESPLATWIFRTVGLVSALSGVWLLIGTLSNKASSSLVQVEHFKADSHRLVAEDAAEQSTKAPNQENSIPSEDDKLEKAIAALDKAIALTPLDPELHYQKGYIASQFADKEDVVRSSFALELILSPTRVIAPLRQSHTLAFIDAPKAIILWEEGMRRALEAQSKPGRSDLLPVHVVERASQQLNGDATLTEALYALMQPFPESWIYWVSKGNPEVVDRLTPELLAKASVEQKKQLLQYWRSRRLSDKAEKWGL